MRFAILCVIKRSNSVVGKNQGMKRASLFKGSHLGRRRFLRTENYLKKMKNAFDFILKLFLFLRYLHFCLDFMVIRNGLIRRFRLISYFIMSQAGQQTVIIHILPNISASKDNQSMKLSQLIEYIVRKIFSQNYAENEVGTLGPDPFLFFNKTLDKVKASGQDLSFNIFWQTSTWTYNKNKFITFQTVDPEICSMLIFHKRFCDQPLHLILRSIFQEKYFSYYILLSDQISLFHCLYFLKY